MTGHDSTGLTDEVRAELNADDDFDGGPTPWPQPDPIPDRPADGASVEKWVDYVVALGADRTYVTQTTLHQDGPSDQRLIPAFKRADLIELADHLGG